MRPSPAFLGHQVIKPLGDTRVSRRRLLTMAPMVGEKDGDSSAHPSR